MRIRKLELHGFKSFPDRTVLHFDPGISCIVGPNGCGKSNVMDALRWCIGEQSARSLRGSEMMDVIFAGSQERKPVGFAEVVMTLTSEGGEPFPGEFAQLAEVSVGRRLHRTGASEYLINQRRVRRRDVVDLFLDTGIGNNLYSFIEQGRIGKIIHARPEERRSLIDEAAGIARYKIRRDEARDRLAATSTQLDRAADVADEMSRRVRSLSRQVKKAARFRRLRALIRQDEIALALAKYGALSQDRRALRTKLRELQTELGAATRGRARREADLTQRRSELSVVEEAVETWRDEVAELDAQARELTSTVSFSNKRLAEIDRQQGADAASLATAQNEIEAAVQERERLCGEQVETQAKIEGSDQVLTTAKQAHETAQAELARVRDQVAGCLRDLGAATVELERLTTDIAQLGVRVQSMPERAQALAEGVQSATQAAAEAGLRIEAGQASADRATAAVEESKEGEALAAAGVAAFRQQLGRAEGALHEARTARDRLAKEERGAADRLEGVVRQAETDLEAARAGLTASVAAQVAATDEAARRRRAERQQEHRVTQSGAQQRAVAWISALELRSSTADKELRLRLDNEDRLSRVAAREALDALQDESDRRLQEGLEAARAEVASRRGQLAEQLEQAEDAAAAVVRQLEQARTHERAAGAEHSAAMAKVAALRAAIDADRSANDGLAVLTQTLGPTPRLVDVLEPAARRDPAVLARIGWALQLPVVSDDQDLLRVSEALPDDVSLSVLLRPVGTLSAADAIGAVSSVPTLGEALDLYRAKGVAAATAQGEGVNAEGLVRLGSPDAAGTQAAEAIQALEQAVYEVEAAERATVDAAEATREAELRQEEVDRQLGDLRTAVDELREDLQRREDQLRERARTAVDADRAQLTEEARQAAAERAGQRQSLLERRRVESEAELGAARRSREAALAALASRADTDIQMLEAELTRLRREASELAQEQAEAQVATLREALSIARTERSTWMAQADARTQSRDAPVDEAQVVVDGLRQELEAARNALATAAEQRSEASQELTRCQSRLAVDRATLMASETEVRALNTQLNELRGEEARLAENLAGAQRMEVEVQGRCQTLTAQRDTLQNELAAAEHGATTAAATLSEVTVAAATWSERARSLVDGLQAVAQRIERGNERITELKASLAAVQTSATETRSTLQRAEAELAECSSRRAESWDRLERERERVRDLKEGVRTGEEDLRQLADRVGKLTLAVDQSTVTLDTTKSEIEGLRNRIEERYQQSVPGLLDRLDVQGSLVLEVDPAVSQSVEIDGEVIEGVEPLVLTSSDLVNGDIITERVDAISTNRQALDRIGDVNLAAFEEWAEVRERHGELEAQRADLETSVARIRSAIAKMNRTCRQRFRDTFDLVNGHFQEMYPRLVGGGSARLSLTNEEDLLETGVDIFVQPPGKRLQNLTLLSGGEKAMTAIALILSLFKVKPSPFCVLDEVDAPLDEANGSRFNEALKEMASASQFIVVTHNRKTMECASTLYGVTMPDPGCSRLVSVRLGE